MKYVKWLLYIFGFVGSIAVLLSTFNIKREFISDNIYFFMVPLWIAIIGLAIIKKYENRKTEKEMLSK